MSRSWFQVPPRGPDGPLGAPQSPHKSAPAPGGAHKNPTYRTALPGTRRHGYQIVARRGRQCGVEVYPHRFRHHFSHTWLYRGGAEGDLMELNGWSSPQMLTRYGASARAARARHTYDRIMEDSP